MTGNNSSGLPSATELLPASRRNHYALVGCLAVLVIVRMLPAASVFRDGFVVLSSNDPYAYRYALEQLLAGNGSLRSLPGVGSGEPLLLTVVWAVTLLFGGSSLAGGLVLALYPVLAAVVTGCLVYAIAVRVSGDSRFGLAAVVMLAVTPAHAYRTSVGFADHHAFDYLWLALTAYALLVLLTMDTSGRKRWAYGGMLGVGVAGQVLAWNAGPLLIVPTGLVIAAVAPTCLRTERSMTPMVAGLGLGATLTTAVHFGLGWLSQAGAASTVLLFAGACGVVMLVAAGRRWNVSPVGFLVVEAVALAGGLAFVWLFLPVGAGFESGLDTLLRSSQIGETSSLIDEYGPILGPLVITGFAPFLALPAVAIGLREWWQRGNVAWLGLTVYTVYFAGLALLQRRFAGEMAPFLAVFAGVGLLALCSWLDLVNPLPQLAPADENGQPPEPIEQLDRTRIAILGALGSILLGTGALYTTFINGRLTIEANAFRTARWMREYADEQGWSYPENFVMSQWGRNRMYNYFVNGQSGSYGYAQNNYEDFLIARDASGWYEEFEGRVGFVVTENFEQVEVGRNQMHTRLHDYLGSGAGGAPGLGHYRAVYSTPGGEYKVFTLVSGATITGESDASRATTDVSIPGREFEYARRIDTSGDGSFAVTVAHPGEYRIGDEEVTISEQDVRSGTTVVLN